MRQKQGVNWQYPSVVVERRQGLRGAPRGVCVGRGDPPLNVRRITVLPSFFLFKRSVSSHHASAFVRGEPVL